MDEDTGIRAPVTRLRRRISIEQSEESKSPAVNTPTKKRGGRRKPDLELIDENTPDNGTTKKTVKKAPIKDLIDSVEEKPVTPSRRSTRIKSNTSIASETVAVDSPRAKRAARRLSQVGSDSEAPLTPVRQTRRTRKDSTSSIEKVEAQSTKPVLHINDVIVEEPENVTRKSSSGTNDTNTSPTNIRKSPRLQGKAKKNDPDTEKENVDQSEPQKQSEHNSIQQSKDELSTEVKDSQKRRVSQTTPDLIKNLKTQARAEKTNLNKSTSALESQLEGKQKRKRTKSWTTLPVSNESNFYSDNEEVKKKLRERTKGKISLDKTNELNSGDGLNNSLKENVADQSISKKKNKNSNSFVVEDTTSVTDSKNNTVNEQKDENGSVILNNSPKSNTSDTIKLFEKDPSANIHTTVFIEDDSDANSGKVHIQNRYEHEDQCVPEVKHTNQLEKDSSKISVSSEKILDIINKSKDNAKLNDSCEPMDIDETIPENLLMAQINTSSPVVLLEKIVCNESNSSGRKSSLSQNINKSGNENKSTLILSQLKDHSTDINNVTKSPRNKDISLKAADDLNTTQEIDASKRNISLNYVTTSTPLQQKTLAKLGNFNTPIIACNDGKDVETNELNQSKNKSKISNKEENDLSKNKLDLEKSVSDKNKSNNTSHNSSSKKVHNSSKVSSEDSEEDLRNEENEISKDKNNSLNKTPNQSSTLNDTDSDNESESDEESRNTSNMLDDQAEDAGDDYESGDSLDENERQYQKENEILEKGESLSSENELSNDSDYEKDSFVVSTDAEDNELLEGTEDDLSMSDNELTMSTKSKKKYNDRKKKEQKNASREMFESRHKLNKSKSKKQIQSSSESEDETETKTKKHNRMRLDSSHEVSLLEDKEKVSKNKSKRLSESICDDNAMNEIEVTLCNESLKETDPLSTSVKDEPKTPQKGDASIAFINTDNDQNVQNELTQTQTEIQDPLDDSMAEEDSLSSDNEIIQNYDSVLESLNKTSKTKAKENDMSLNIDKKQKKNKNTTIVDELNLTQAKPTKKLNKNKQKESVVESTKTKLDADDGASSDSIDLQLLFSEDSNTSDNIQNKQNVCSSNKDQFIPLKKTEGKTNLRESIETNIDMSTSLNESSSKKNKKDTSINISDDDSDANGVGFFIDTEGSFNKSANKSISKSKKKKMSLENHDASESDSNEVAAENDKSLRIEETVAVENSDSDAPMDVPFRKEKRLSKSFDNTAEDIENETDTTTQAGNKSLLKTPGSSKKKKRASQSEPEQEDIIKLESENSLQKTPGKKNKRVSQSELQPEETTTQADDKSLLKTPGSSKKKKRVSQSESQEQEDTTLPVSDKSLLKTPFSSKKNKRVSQSEQDQEDTTLPIGDKSLLKTPGSSKKKKRVSQSEQEQEDTTLPVSDKSLLKTPGSSKKKKHLSYSEEEQEDATVQASNMSLLKTPVSSKKKKRVSQSEQEQEETKEESFNLFIFKTPGSQKKKKKSDSQETDLKEIEDTSESSLDRSKVKSPGSHKKSKVIETQEPKPVINEESNTNFGSAKKSKKNNTSSSIIEAPLLLTSAVNSENNDTNTKKRKRKSSLSNNTQEETIEDVNNTHKKSNDTLVVSQKKKRKISPNEEIISIAEPTVEENPLQPQNISKEKKLKKQCEPISNNTEPPKLSRSNKRKHRDEDEENSVSKVVKQSSFDKVHVPRLPATILNQLDDKPKEISMPKKPKVVSTTEFAVVEAKIRKNKPSNYLEESVYLNDDEVLDKKRKKRLPKPKVLPFVPTASTSCSGYTSNFKISVIPSEIKFVAQSNAISNFKDEYLFNKKIKRQGTYELYKRNRNIKLSKF